MKRTRTRRSLQWRLTLGLCAAVVLTAGMTGVLSFAWALHDANEILDGTLAETAAMIASGQMAVPRRPAELPGSEPENDVFVLPLGASGSGPQVGMGRALSNLGAGLHTVSWQGRSWRVLVTSLAGGSRIAIAQSTDARDEVAQHSALRTLIPLLLLIPLLVLLVREVVRRALHPVAALAQHVDSNAMVSAARLPDADVPVEIEPFVQSIRRLLQELTETLDQQRRFVANAAHELRSPIAALNLQAANLQPVVDGEEGRKRLEQLRRGIDRMRRLLEQLLSMARSEVDDSGLLPVPLGEVAREVIAELVPAAAARGIDLGMDRCDPEACVRGTVIGLHTLLRNVVENAIKFSPPGAMVNVSVFREGNEAAIAVEDEGPGIADAQMERIFEPFYRVPGTREHGSGLGLAIVAAIAKRLGGRLALQPGSSGTGIRFEYRQRTDSS